MTSRVVLDGRLKDDAKVEFDTEGQPIADFILVVEDQSWRPGSKRDDWTQTSFVGVSAILPKFEGEEDQLYKGDQVGLNGVLGQYEDTRGKRHTRVRVNRGELRLIRRGPVGRGEERKPAPAPSPNPWMEPPTEEAPF